RMAAAGETRHVAGALARAGFITVEGRREDRRTAIVEKDVQAANGPFMPPSSKAMERRTDLTGTSHPLAAASTLPCARAAAARAAVGTPLSVSMGWPNDRVGSTTTYAEGPLGNHRRHATSVKLDVLQAWL